MAIFEQINEDIKKAMLAREQIKLETLRSIKAAFLLAKTEGAVQHELSSEKELQILQKLLKQRKESAEIYKNSNRNDLADKELFEAGVIEQYLPEQMPEEELIGILKEVIVQADAKSASDFGRVMGMATKRFAGRVDGKIIAEIVRKLLP